VKTFDPLSLPKDTAARAPFLDPTALFSDQVYLVRPLDKEAEGSGHNASFVGGEQAMVGYLKTRVLQHIAPGIGWLKPPVLHFQVDATGAPTQGGTGEDLGQRGSWMWRWCGSSRRCRAGKRPPMRRAGRWHRPSNSWWGRADAETC
jgi:hypothetical protein